MGLKRHLATLLLLVGFAAFASYVIEPGPDWIPLAWTLDVQPGSALDFSHIGQVDAPCGKHGRLVVNEQGKFAFADQTQQAQRFYGVNLCFSANYMTHQESDRFVDRLVRLGYNSLRLHHHDGNLITWQGKNSLDFSADAFDKLDYLIAACGKRGIYITTDGYVSRQVAVREIWPDGQGKFTSSEFKLLIQFNDRAYDNLVAYMTTFLTHHNPYTGKRYADDPTIAWLAVINEGLSTDSVHKTRPRIQAEIEAAYGKPLPDKYQKSVEFADFLTQREQDTYARLRQLIREHIKSDVLLTNMNGINHIIAHHRVHTDFDYVDAHAYVDHPAWFEKQWRLPSKLKNSHPLTQWSVGGTHRAFLRLDKVPFTITELNFSAPNQFRGMGGLITGSLASVQDWDGIWRFAYSHHHDHLFGLEAMDFFNLSRDPLNQATERALLCLFLRGDMPAATERLTIALPEEQLRTHPAIGKRPHPSWHHQAFQHHVSIRVGEPAPGERTMDDLLSQQPPAPPQPGPFTIDHELVRVNTDRTAGGFAGDQQQISAGPLQATVSGHAATLWVSSLDEQPITESSRLLLTHLTDLQNTGITYRDESRTVLESWGRLPHLVRRGEAQVILSHKQPESLTIHALNADGSRAHTVPGRHLGETLQFSISTDDQGQARMLYELIHTPQSTHE